MSDSGQLILSFIVELFIIKGSFSISGAPGLLVFALANALLLMFCYYQDKVEKQERREKKRVIMFADGRKSAIERKEVIK